MIHRDVTSKAVDTSIETSSRSLTDAQATIIERALRDSWSIDRHITCDRRLALMLSPLDSALTETVFYVEAEGVELSLSIMRDDDLQFDGRYNNIEALLAAIQLPR